MSHSDDMLSMRESAGVLIFITLILGSVASANPRGARVTRPAQQDDCPPIEASPLPASLVRQGEDLRQLIDAFTVARERLPRPGRIFNRRCENFITSEGLPGEWGNIVIDAIERVNYRCFLGPDRVRFEGVCPHFANFSDARKRHFWLWVFASIAHEEASCDHTAIVPGINGLAAGLLGLEHDPKLRAASARDPRFCAPNVPTDTTDPKFNITCGASILADNFCGRDGSREPKRNINFRGGYWEKLRGGRDITALIRAYPGCGNPESGQSPVPAVQPRPARPPTAQSQRPNDRQTAATSQRRGTPPAPAPATRPAPREAAPPRVAPRPAPQSAPASPQPRRPSR